MRTAMFRWRRQLNHHLLVENRGGFYNSRGFTFFSPIQKRWAVGIYRGQEGSIVEWFKRKKEAKSAILNYKFLGKTNG